MLILVKRETGTAEGLPTKITLPGMDVADRPTAVSSLSRSYMGTGVSLPIFQAAHLDNFTAIHGEMIPLD
jgi:hypothetical protein